MILTDPITMSLDLLHLSLGMMVAACVLWPIAATILDRLRQRHGRPLPRLERWPI